jgi:ABC-type phosphate transport system ATPase subunit
MIYAFISLVVITIGAIAVFVGVNSSHNKEIHINNERLDKMFEFLKKDIDKLKIQTNEIKQQIDVVNQQINNVAKDISILDNITKQLRSGDKSKLY